MVVTLKVPTSKSYTQRALIMAALAPGTSQILQFLDCDDSQVLRAALTDLGIPIARCGDQLKISGGGQLVAPSRPINLKNAGTAVRFVSGLAPLVKGSMTIEGVEAMRRRPMPGLIRALRSVGVVVEELGAPSCPPLRFKAEGSTKGHLVRLDPRGSSQQLSALLLVAPRLPAGLTIELEGELPSRPYVEMTLHILCRFGAQAGWIGPNALQVAPLGLQATRYEVEGDLSAAAMVLAGAWISGKKVSISNLPQETLQGDAVFSQVLAALSRAGPREIDLGDAPDVVPPAVAAALFAQGQTRLINIAHLRIKESDRISVLASELSKAGAHIETTDDTMTIHPKPLSSQPAVLDPHDDHRMAMAFGLVSLRGAPIVVTNRDCVSKSFPNFWEVLEVLR